MRICPKTKPSVIAEGQMLLVRKSCPGFRDVTFQILNKTYNQNPKTRKAVDYL